MALGRFLVTWIDSANPAEDGFSNTLYFNISGSIDEPGWNTLATDIGTLYANQSFTNGRQIEVRAYDMADAKPRPQKALYRPAKAGSLGAYVPQVALCLSYYADRNLPRQRGRIYTGPYTGSANGRPAAATRSNLITFGQGLAGIGGLNVDWSLWSPTTQQHTRLSNIWVDDSFDIIRSRKLPSTTRSSAEING